MSLEFLSSGGFLSEELNYTTDEDGVVHIRQGDQFINLTPRQCLDLKELLSSHLDMLQFTRSKGGVA